MSQWYIIYNGDQVGPMKQEQLLSYDLNPQSQVWCEGMPQWVAAYTLPDLMSMMSEAGRVTGTPYSDGGTPPRPHQQAYQQSYAQQEPYQEPEKSKTTAGVLALLLGSLGIQYFYLGKVGGGFITILLSLITCGCWSILTFVQGILMLTMSQQEFDRKFVYTKSTFPLF